jgi:signal transduction histidine kinase
MEITQDPQLRPDEISLLDMHSILNILNVLQYEFMCLGAHIGDTPELDSLCEAAAVAGRGLTQPDLTQQSRTLAVFVDRVFSTLDTMEQTRHLSADDVYCSTRENLRGIFGILSLRWAELNERRESPLRWKAHDIVTLQDNFGNVLHAIERNSKGGYRIVHNLAEHEEGRYLIHFDISGFDGKTLFMPPVFQDVMRDLLANARKYTPPGGVITAGLYDDGDSLRFVVEDNGCGIPERDLPHVVGFGYRGSNVVNRPTRGGGFGLTKAFYVTRQFGGRLWIESPISDGHGTRIEIRIPRTSNSPSPIPPSTGDLP